MVDLEAVAKGLLAVVLALDQARAVLVADSLVLGRVELHVVDVGGVLDAHAPAGQAPHDLLVGHLHEQRRSQRAPLLGQRVLERVCLLLVARKAVQQEAVAGVIGGHPARDHLHDQLVGDEVAVLHVLARALAKHGALGDLGAEDVAGGDVRQAEVLAQPLGLRALAGARRAEQDQVHL